MKTEEEIREALRLLNKSFYDENFKQDYVAGAITTLNWVLESEVKE